MAVFDECTLGCASQRKNYIVPILLIDVIRRSLKCWYYPSVWSWFEVLSLRSSFYNYAELNFKLQTPRKLHKPVLPKLLTYGFDGRSKTLISVTCGARVWSRPTTCCPRKPDPPVTNTTHLSDVGIWRSGRFERLSARKKEHSSLVERVVYTHTLLI